MAVKAVEMVRKIRDKHYEETKDLTVEEQIKFVKDKSRKLQGTLLEKHPSTDHNRVRKST